MEYKKLLSFTRKPNIVIKHDNDNKFRLNKLDK